MSEGLSIEGDKILYDGQQVGVITIREGTSLHADVIRSFIRPNQHGYDRGYARGYEKGLAQMKPDV